MQMRRDGEVGAYERGGGEVGADERGGRSGC